MSKKNGNLPEQDALLQHQAAIDAAKQQLETLQGIVSQQESTLADLQGQLPEIAALEQQHEDLLAEIATGGAEPAAAEALDKTIADARAKKAEIDPAIALCQKTISGVQRKVQDQAAALDALKSSTGNLVKKYLLAEAERIAQDFLPKATALIDDYKRLEGIAALLGPLGHPWLRPHGSEMVLPAFNLPAFQGKTLFHNPGLIFKLSGHGETMPFFNAEVERIKALGIEFEFA